MREGIKRLLALLLALTMCVPAWAAETAGEAADLAVESESSAVAAESSEPEEEISAAVEEAPEEAAAAEPEEATASDVSSSEAVSDTLPAPVLQSAATASTQDSAGNWYSVIQVTWETVDRAVSYEILRQTEEGSWETAGYASAEEGADTAVYDDYDVTLYQSYVYTVRCLDSDGQPVSDWDEGGVGAYYPSGSCGDSVTWQLTTGGVLEIAGTGAMYDTYNVELTPWYALKDRVESAQVGEGVTYLSSYAFQGCTGLASVTLPDSLTGLGQYAFLNCTSLTEIAIPDGVTQLPERVFYLCTGLRTVTLPQSLTLIGKGAFDGCACLTDLAIPASVTEIGSSAFSDCASLTEITLPQGVTALGMNTFYGCTSLEQITFPDGFTQLGMYALASCTSLTELELPASLTSIGRGALNGCTGLETVTFLGSAPETVTAWFGSTACVAQFTAACQESWLALDLSSAGASVSWKVLDQATGESHYLAPTLLSAQSELAGITVTWQALTGASCYRVLRREAGQTDWTELGETIETSWLDSDVASGITYTYTVLAVDSREVAGYYDTDGITAQAASLSGSCGDGLTWALEDGTLTITGKGSLYDYESGEAPWASWQSQIRSVVLSSGVTGLGDNAFSGCTALETVWFSGSAPTGAEHVFPSQTVTAYYPAADSWTAERRLGLGEQLIWVAWSPSTGEVQPCATPVLTVASAVGGVRITWSAVEGAECYAVFRWNAEKQSWVRLGTTEGVTWLDTGAPSGADCRYTVRCLQAGSYASAYDRPGQSVYYLAAPSVTVANSATGVTVSWSSVAGASGYAVYRKAAGGKWVHLTDLYTGSLRYTDRAAQSGTTYYYTVRALDDGQRSAYRSDISIYCLAQPTVGVANSAAGVRVTWSKSAGAQSYRIYRKTASTGWRYMAEATGLSWTDQTAQSGTAYYYTVRASKAETLSSYVSGVTVLYLAQPTPAVSNGSKGVSVSWNRISGATGYYVYRKTPGGSWRRIATIQGGSTLQYTDTGVKSSNGVTYVYTVRAVKSGTLSSYYAGKTIIRITAPTLRSVTRSGSGKLTVRWTTNSKATGYQIAYATNASFTNAKQVTVTSSATASRVLSGLTKKKTYYVRIRAVCTKDGVTSYSAWSSTATRYLSQ